MTTRHGDILLKYNVLQGLVDVQWEDLFEAPSGRDIRRLNFQLRYLRFHRARRATFFSVGLPRGWNALTLEVVTALTLITFKRLLNDLWAFVFLDVL